jgi:RimJ/RimL family protein N-acetyltransferase
VSPTCNRPSRAPWSRSGRSVGAIGRRCSRSPPTPLIWEGHPERDRYQEPLFRQFFESALEGGSAFAILDKESGRIIGSSRYFGHDPILSEIEIGWTFLARPYWGGAYNRAVKRLMLEHAFSIVDTVVFWVGKDNVRSRRAMEKIGGVLREGELNARLQLGPVPTCHLRDPQATWPEDLEHFPVRSVRIRRGGSSWRSPEL